jgi:hypothetical protein
MRFEAAIFTSLSLRFMIGGLLGKNPRFLRIASNCSFNSGDSSGGSDFSRGDRVVVGPLMAPVG